MLTVRSKWLPSSYFLNFICGEISNGEKRAADFKFIVIIIIIIITNISVVFIYFILKYPATSQ